MLLAGNLATVGAVIAIIGGVCAAAATLMRLVWEVQDRRRERRTDRVEDAPTIRTYTPADMRAAIRDYDWEDPRDQAKGAGLNLLFALLLLLGLFLLLLDWVLR